ncbi:hypothetical protein F0562_020099 [Nyssa sinensis]|uniref:G-patch domain-containing protein n=1 Tax=Nyssa sinensis TaxID=561372 RepID=A0A5J5BQQ1_9ASTE|nr:hypothetical protein F0562_020099 [Nyssa sinensis]
MSRLYSSELFTTRLSPVPFFFSISSLSWNFDKFSDYDDKSKYICEICLLCAQIVGQSQGTGYIRAKSRIRAWAQVSETGLDPTGIFTAQTVTQERSLLRSGYHNPKFLALFLRRWIDQTQQRERRRDRNIFAFSAAKASSCRVYKMDNRWYNGRQETHTRDKRHQKMEEAHEDPIIEDLAEDFRLPINHKPTENVDLDNVEQASLETQLTSSNVGFRLLQKMGWKGKGLGKDEQGIIEPIRSGIRDPKLGVGKQEEDDFFTAEENIQRKKLDVEVEETVEIAKKREVIAERENKIQTEVKEIRKVFYCELCNKQYKLAMEFEAHLSSYDHNHRKRFKGMREMHGSSSRDDRQKREQQRQEREMAKFAQMADARKQQQQEQEQSGTPIVSTALVDQDQRKALKFGFSSKVGTSKNSISNAAKKPKVTVASVFSNDSDEE